MRLIEILTEPYKLNCECAPCIDGTYLKMFERANGLASQSEILLLHDNLSEILKMGNKQVDLHSKIRFAILLNIFNDDNQRLIFLKNLIFNTNFDLEFLDTYYIYDYVMNRLGMYSGIRSNHKGVASRDVEKIINNAYVFREFPELIDDDILQYETEKIVSYAISIFSMGMERFELYFSQYSVDKLILTTHILVDHLVETRHAPLVKVIQKVYKIISNRHLKDVNSTSSNSYVSLTNKVLSQCNDKCLPFETSNFGAKTFEEYLYLKNQVDSMKEKLEILNRTNLQKIQSLDLSITQLSNTIQSIQKEIGEKEKQKSHNKKSAIRIEYLNGIGFLHPLARLKNIIDSEQPIFYYPDFMFDDVFEHLIGLSTDEKNALLIKLATVNRGVLKKLKNELLK